MDRTSSVSLEIYQAEPEEYGPEPTRPRARMARSLPTELANAAMQRYVRGDGRAFAQLHRLVAPRLLVVCRRLAGPAGAEDLMQEVFLKMHRARATFTPDGSVLSWAAAIARTTFFDQVRYRKRRPETATDQHRLEAHAATNVGTPDLNLALQYVEIELAGLSDNLRTAFWLVRFEGMSCAEAAGMLGTTTDAIKQRVHRASDAIKAGLLEAGF